MKTLKSLCLAMAVISLSACVNVPKEFTPIKKNDLNFGLTQSWDKQIKLDESIKKNTIFVEFVDAPSMTLGLKEHLKAKGYNVVDDKKEAKYSLNYEGYIQEHNSYRSPGWSVSFGKALENTVTQDDQNQKSITEYKKTAFWAGLSQVNQVGNLVIPSEFSFARGVMTLVKATGLSDAINKATTGDRRGLCLTGCDRWRFVSQQVAIFVRLNNGNEEKKTRIEVGVAIDPRADQKDQWDELMKIALKKAHQSVVFE
jgi:hypothetical protein